MRLTILHIQREFVGLRRNVMAYTLTGDQKPATRANELIGRIRKDMAQVADDISIPARKTEFMTSAKVIDEYWSDFENATKLRAARSKLITERLDGASTKIREGVAQIYSLLMADDNYEAAALAGQAQSAFMTTQSLVCRYMVTIDPRIATNAKMDFESCL